MVATIKPLVAFVLRVGRARPYTLAALIMFLVMAVPFLARTGDWERCFHLDARRLWEGDTIYGHATLNPCPPLPCFVAIPFAYLPFAISKVLFYSLCMAALILMVRWAWRLSGGGRLEGAKVAPAEHVAMVLGLLCSITFAWNSLSHHQTDVLIDAALIGGCLALSRSRSYLAATCFGLAGAMKGPALLFAPYLAWRGRWREAGWVFAVFIGVNIMPTLVVPAQHHRFLFGEWILRYLSPMGESSDYPFFWYTESNQSLIGCGFRWLTTTWAWTGSFSQRLPIAHPASPAGVKGFVLMCAAMLGLFTMLVQGRRRLPEAAEPDGRMRLALECGMVLLLMLLFSPMSGKAHFGLFLVPAFCILRVMRERRSIVLGMVFAATLLAVLLSQNFMGDRVVCIAMWYGTVTWAAFLMLVGCGYALRHCLEGSPAPVRRVDPGLALLPSGLVR